VEHLIRLGLARPGRIVASGASAGGTLVGAAVNMRPDLFGAVYAEVPFVDCLNTARPHAAAHGASFSEFGNPIEARADFLTKQSYAPYENVRTQAHPPMLILQSLNDARVPYWEAAKWTAKVRRLKSDANPLVLLTKMRGGHGGWSGRFDSLEDYARGRLRARHRGANLTRRDITSPLAAPMPAPEPAVSPQARARPLTSSARRRLHHLSGIIGSGLVAPLPPTLTRSGHPRGRSAA